MEIDNIIKEHLKKNKPDISDSSVKTYVSIIKNLFYKMNTPGTKFEPSFFENFKTVSNFLKQYEPKNRKTYLAAIISFLGPKNPVKNDYSICMYKDADIAKEDDQQQKKNDKQKENSISKDELKIYLMII